MSCKIHKTSNDFEHFKGSTLANYLGSGKEIPQIGRYGGHVWQTWFLGGWMHE